MSFVTAKNVRGFIILFVFGAVFLTLLDSVHVHTQTLAYVRPFVRGSAWWVPLLMGCSTSLGGLAYVMGWRRLGGPAKLASWPRIAIAIAAFALMYAASGLLPATTTSKLIIITVGAIAIHREVDGSRVGAILALVGAVCGPIAEAINPGFRYIDPDFAGVTVWLPALYACVTPALGQLARRLMS